MPGSASGPAGKWLGQGHSALAGRQRGWALPPLLPCGRGCQAALCGRRRLGRGQSWCQAGGKLAGEGQLGAVWPGGRGRRDPRPGHLGASPPLCPPGKSLRVPEVAGTSLLQEVVYLVSQGADPDEIGLMNIDEQLPVLEYPQPGLDILKELTSPRLIKSHLPYRFLPSDLHDGDSKVIYMARNPKDLVVSYYQFHRSLRTMSYRGTFQEFCRRFMNDKLGYGSWFEHVQEFWEHRTDSNVLFLKYEDMHRDLVTMVEQLARFLGVACDKAQLESLIEHCHQLVDQCCNAEALPVGRGRVGLWKDIFTVSMNEKFDLVYKQKMGKCDVAFDFCFAASSTNLCLAAPPGAVWHQMSALLSRNLSVADNSRSQKELILKTMNQDSMIANSNIKAGTTKASLLCGGGPASSECLRSRRGSKGDSGPWGQLSGDRRVSASASGGLEVLVKF
nr:unnamed protein product [Sorex araneus]